MANTNARLLRRYATDAERQLWRLLRARRLEGFKFRRQHPIGLYIADFACMAARLVVEADGGQHSDRVADLRRTEWLQAAGWRVIRFWNDQILLEQEVVLAIILAELRNQSG
jgi:very-short-patch-repair endonuclease